VVAVALALSLLVQGAPTASVAAASARAEPDDAVVERASSLLVTTSGLPDGLDLLAHLPPGTRGLVAADGAERLLPGVTRLRAAPVQAASLRRALRSVPGVVAVEPERTWAYRSPTPDDPLINAQWAHGEADAPGGWAITTGTRDVSIAILDSGIDARHPDLVDRVVAQEVVRADARGGLRVEAALSKDNDECREGHGTLVAGVAAATGNNGQGIAGAAWRARVIDIALSTPGACAPSDAKVIAALGRLASADFQRLHGRVDAVNLSLGGIEGSGRCPAALQRAIDTVVSQGTVVVAAVGNHHDLRFSVPAGCRDVIAVGATSATGARAVYSGMSRTLDVTAPGGDAGGTGCTAQRCILSTARLDDAGRAGYALAQGTSFAAPYVSGAVALLRSTRPGATPAQVESIIERTARHPQGAAVHDHHHGWGGLQVGAALRYAREHDEVPAPRVHPALRVAAGSGATKAVAQAVAASRAAFPGGTSATPAAHAVLAREDDFADALAGSSLTAGVAPLLFAPRSGSLPPATAAELQRVLPRGADVYLLGGTNALGAGLDAEIRALGFRARRLQGPTREATAVAVARQVEATRRALRLPPAPAVALANRDRWPDAISGGALGATFGIPILLTARDGLHPTTAAYLVEQRRAAGASPARVYALGGAGVLGTATAQAAGTAARAPVQRLSGPSRDTTAIAVSAEVQRLLRPGLPPYAIAIELDRADGFAHALSAAVLAGSTSSVFVPVRAPSAGERLTDATVDHACGLGGDALLAGDADLLPDRLGAELVAVLAGSSPRCGRR
jgi:subtilisin family serine protease